MRCHRIAEEAESFFNRTNEYPSTWMGIASSDREITVCFRDSLKHILRKRCKKREKREDSLLELGQVTEMHTK